MNGHTIDAPYFWTIIFLMMIGTLTIRGSIIAASARVKIPDRVRELFSYIPAAILPAFVAPSVFFHQGQVEMMLGKERLVVLVLAGALCMWTKSTLSTILFGLIVLFMFTQYL